MYVGIDVSKRSLMAHAMDQDGKDIFHSFNIKNNKPGCNKLIDFIYKHANQSDFESIKIAMEATNVYWEHSYRLINNSEKLNSNFKLSTHILNPKVVKNFKNAYNSLPKTDSIDAWVIADKIRFNRVPKPAIPEEIYRPLRELTRFRYKLIKNIRSEKNRALSLVFLKFSDLEEEAPFDVFSEASMTILESFTLEEIADKDLEDLAAFLYENSNNRLGGSASLDEIITDLKKAARDSYRLKPKMNQAITQTLSMTFDNIRFLQRQLNRSKKVLKRELKAIPQTLDTVDGIGVVLTSGIIAEIGDIDRFDNQAALASYAGLTWTKHQSGSFVAEETSMTKTGNKYLRYYLVEAANSLRVHNDEYKKYYYKKYHESQKHKHKRALVLTARKFVRLVFALLSKGEIYQPRR
ncbi:MAG: IS110 family transposase [Promethearchaeia archaeon]